MRHACVKGERVERVRMDRLQNMNRPGHGEASFPKENHFQLVFFGANWVTWRECVFFSVILE